MSVISSPILLASILETQAKSLPRFPSLSHQKSASFGHSHRGKLVNGHGHHPLWQLLKENGSSNLAEVSLASDVS